MDSTSHSSVIQNEYLIKFMRTIRTVSNKLDFRQFIQKYIFFFAVLLSSVPFLIITVAIYAWLPELRNLPGKCLMCYTTCVIVLYVIISLTIFLQPLIIERLPSLCFISGYVQYVLFLMCLMWLNVMIYNLWLNLR